MTVDEFDQKVVPIPLAGCWLWTGAASSLGYGNLIHEGKRYLAHRFSWQRAYGPIADGLCVMHRCDVPACVNPEHLQLGTMRDNTRDMMAKQRDRFVGARNPGAKLTAAQVQEIRGSRESGPKAARRYGVSRSTITAIRRHETRVTAEGEAI